jgi:transcriptional regulator with XRE-family HTH domain
VNDSILILDGLSVGQKAKLTRLAKRLRQIDVASQANVQPIDITRLEKDRYVLPTRRRRILEILGLLENEESKDTN